MYLHGPRKVVRAPRQDEHGRGERHVHPHASPTRLGRGGRPGRRRRRRVSRRAAALFCENVFGVGSVAGQSLRFRRARRRRVLLRYRLAQSVRERRALRDEARQVHDAQGGHARERRGVGAVRRLAFVERLPRRVHEMFFGTVELRVLRRRRAHDDAAGVVHGEARVGDAQAPHRRPETHRGGVQHQLRAQRLRSRVRDAPRRNRSFGFGDVVGVVEQKRDAKRVHARRDARRRARLPSLERHVIVARASETVRVT